MALASEIAAWLASQGVGTVNTDIFLTRLPDSPAACLAIIPYPGLPAVSTMGTDNIYQRPRFQVVVRNTTYSLAYGKAYAAWLALTFTNQTLSAIRYLRCESLQSEFLIERDASERTILKCNYEAMKEKS